MCNVEIPNCALLDIFAPKFVFLIPFCVYFVAVSLFTIKFHKFNLNPYLIMKKMGFNQLLNDVPCFDEEYINSHP